MTIPVFKSDEEEAEFWDTHSPLDFLGEPDAKVVKVKVPKDRIVVIRLDSETLQKLEKLAAEHNVGPSTFARLILMSALKGMADKSKDAGEDQTPALSEEIAMTEEPNGNSNYSTLRGANKWKKLSRH